MRVMPTGMGGRQVCEVLSGCSCLVVGSPLGPAARGQTSEQGAESLCKDRGSDDGKVCWGWRCLRILTDMHCRSGGSCGC